MIKTTFVAAGVAVLLAFLVFSLRTTTLDTGAGDTGMRTAPGVSEPVLGSVSNFDTYQQPQLRLWEPAAIPYGEEMDRDIERHGEPQRGVVDDPYGRENWFMRQRMFPFDRVPDDARRVAFEEVLNRGEGLGPKNAATTWVPIGPLPTTSAFPVNGFSSGRINSIAISPANNQLLLVGSATGGIWRSTNGGTSFTPVSDAQADTAVGSIAFAPSDPNIAYAGMGDNDNGYFGSGVLKSTDAGATWTRVSTTLPARVQSTRLRVDPTDPNKVYLSLFNSLDTANCTSRPCAGVIGGVFISTDGGVNWTRTLIGQASDLAIHPTNPQIIYAALRLGDSETAPRGLFKSTNGGTTWTNVFASPYTASQQATKDFRVSVTPAAPDRVYVYFGSDGPPPQVRLEMSSDAGATWTTRGVVNVNQLDPGQYGYNTYLEASPVDADTVAVGARDTFMSTNGGVAFTNINNSFVPPWECDACYTPANQKFHADQQAFTFEPGSGTTFYCGNDGGLWKTTNGGTTFTSLNATLSLTQFIGLSLSPADPLRTYGGAQDNGSQRRTGGTAWHEFSGGDGGKAVVNVLNPAMIFHSYINGSITRNINHGVTFDGAISSTAALGEPPNGRVGFYPPIVGNGVDSRLYVGTYRLMVCTNCDNTSVFIGTGGTAPNWSAPGGTFDQTTGGNDTLSAIAIARSNTQIIYTGSEGGRVMVSTDGGATWTDITTGLPTRSIANITVSATDPTRVFLTVSGYGSGHVFRSTNSGGTWTDISGNLPNIPTSAFLIDPLTATTLYAGTDIGVFRSTNDGGSWEPFNNGLPPVPVTEFTANANGLIQIGTYGRGAYELPLATAATPTPTPAASPTPSPTPTATQTPAATPTPTPPANARKPLFDFDADGKADVAVYRPSNGNWYVNRSRDGFYAQNFGNNTDKLAPADYDGDGKTDVAVYKPSTGVFFIYRSSDGGDGSAFWGLAEDIPCPADFDGDGKADVAIFRPSTGTFWIRRSASGNSPLAIQYGANGDQPVVGDYDGDGKADVAVYRPTTGIWYIHLSQNNGDTAVQFGIPSDKAVPGDFDGDGKTDIAVYRTVTGLWFVVNSTGGYTSYQFGYPTDTPAPADYDGDGKIDMSIFRPGENNFWINGSRAGVTVIGWGAAGDIPIANAYVR